MMPSLFAFWPFLDYHVATCQSILTCLLIDWSKLWMTPSLFAFWQTRQQKWSTNLDYVRNQNDVYTIIDSLLESSVDEELEETNREMLDPRAVACVLCTSGSTGVPKGVYLSHETIMNRLAWHWSAYPIDSLMDGTCRSQDLAQLRRSSSWDIRLPAWMISSSVVIELTNLSNPDALINTISEHRITMLIFSTSTWKSALLNTNV